MSSTPPQSSLLNRWLPTIVFILAALGVPAAAIVSFTRFVTEHLWLAIIIGLVYEIVVFVLGFFGKVLQKLGDRWVDRTVDRVDYRTLSMLSGYKKRYCKYLIYQHRDFDVKGLSLQGPYALELDQVFIELSIDSTTLQQMSANPIPVPRELREGSHIIWDFLASAPLAKQHLVIVGPPGSGKTTLLKHITLMLLAHGKSHHARIRVPHKLPILLFLRDHAAAIHASASKDKPDFTLVEALQDHLKRWEQPDPPVGWIKRQLDDGRCLVLLDGLDEVADPQVRKEVVSWVQTQMAAFREDRFIITSRPFGFRDNPLSGVAMLEARPFTPEQVERFIHKWYLANEIMSKQKDDEGVRMRARADAKGLLQQLYNNPTLLALTVNPLLLTMIAIVHRYGGGGKLPEKRVSLYADICKVFLGKRQEAKGQQLQLKPEQIQLVLEPLAFYMMDSNTRDITLAQASIIIKEPLELVNTQLSVADFLKLVENVSGLLLEREFGIYCFAHLTFQEYLAAIYIDKKQWGNSLTRFVKDSWWRETLLLYCAMADATPIIEACLADTPPSIPALIMAFNCQKDALKLQMQAKARLETVLGQGIEDSDPQRQYIAAELLLAQRLDRMVYIKKDTFIDTSLITHAEYQLFLDEQRVQGKYYQPDHWQNYRFSPGQGNTPVSGVRSSDAATFCDWLTDREVGSWRYRLPALDELQQIGYENILNNFPAATGYWSNARFVWLKEPLLIPDNITQGFSGFDFAQAHDLDLELTRVLARARDGVRNFELVLDLELVRDRKLARELDSVRELVRNFALELALTRDLACTRDLTRVRARELALEIIDHIHYVTQKKGISKHTRDEIYRIANNYLDTYITLVLLEERRQGQLPACEGILIVKERKQENT